MSVALAPGQGLLAPLREDLKLFAAAPNRDGSPAWMIQDPIGNRFFRVGWLEFEVLSRWSLRDPALVARAISDQTALRVDAEQVAAVGDFFRQQQLLAVRDAEGVRRLAGLDQKSRLSAWKWLLHHYLFVRIPIVRPQRFLQWLAPHCELFYSRLFWWLACSAGLLGVLLALRQWEVFVGTFTNFMSPAGLAGWALALIFAKTLHELGHAITATRLGVRVAHMGVAFLVMWPMLYTDTGESWRLPRREDRFRIAAAGMAAELALAGFATLAWSLVPDGSLRSALFFLASTSWIITLGINASPFMRFDGYFLLSDALDLPNLHARSFALARTALRRGLFGWNEPDPELFSPRLRRFLIVFAWLTWTYRLIVFVGIAIAVYLFFFKALGVFLFAVEIAWFILRPLWSEARVWIDRRRETGVARLGLLIMIGGLLGLVLLLPWQHRVAGEAWMHPARVQTLYSPFAARVLSLHDAGPVREGAVLVALDSPEARGRAVQLRAGTDALRRELAGSVGRADGASQHNLILERLARELAALDSERQELDRLSLRAPYAGKLVDRDHQVRAGTWVSANQPLGILIDPKRWIADALLAPEDVQRIKPGAAVTFYIRNDPGEPLTGRVAAIDSVRLMALPEALLADVAGGRVATIREPNGRLVPRHAWYRVRIDMDQSPIETGSLASERITLGSVRVEGERRSLLGHWLTTIASVFIRESGF